MADLSLEDVIGDIPKPAASSPAPIDLSLEDVASEKEKPEQKRIPKPELNTSEKITSSLGTATSRLAGVPADFIMGLANTPALAAKAASWLTDSDMLRHMSEKLTPDEFNKLVAPYGGESVIRKTHERWGTEPYQATSPLGAIAQSVTERGPAFAATGAALGIPKALNLWTSAISPASGEIASRTAGGSDTARMLGEVGSSLLTPPAAWGISALRKERNLRSRNPVGGLEMTDPRFQDALPYVREEFQRSFQPSSREQLLAGITNPDAANLSFNAVRPGLQQRISDVDAAALAQRQRREGQATQAYTQTEMTERANQMARELAASQAEHQVGALERQMRGSVRYPEDVGAALQSQISDAREGMRRIVEPGYASGWEKESIPLTGRRGMADAITNTLQEAAARKDFEITPTNFLSQQLDKIVGTTRTGQEFLRAMPAEVAVQMRRSIDDAVGQYRTQLGDTAGSMRKDALSNLRTTINDALDNAAKTNPKLAALRQADKDYAQYIAPLQQGLTRKVLESGEALSTSGQGMKQVPELAAETLIPKGTKGVDGARNLFKAFESQQQAGLSSDITQIVGEHLQNLILSKTKDNDLVGGINKVLNTYGPFIREFDNRFGTNYHGSMRNYIPQQEAAQTAATSARESATQGQRDLTRLLEGAQRTQQEAIQSAESTRAARTASAREGVTGQMAESNAPGNMFREIMRDPERMPDAISLIRSAQKTGRGNDAYEGILGAFRADMQDMLTGGPSFGGANRSQQIMGNYERALRAAGAPDQMITNLRGLLNDAERIRSSGGVLPNNILDATRMNKQILYGSLGRQGGLLEAAMRTFLGGEDVGLEIARQALRDPAVAQAVFNYRGSNPSHFMHYLMRNPVVAGIVEQGPKESEIRPKRESQ